MALKTLGILPLRGIQNDVDAYSVSKEPMDKTGQLIMTNTPEMVNMSLSRKDGSIGKALGHKKYSNSVTSSPANIQWIKEWRDVSGNTNRLFGDNGYLWELDSSLDPQDRTIAATQYSSDQADLWDSEIYGAYVIIADRGETTLQKWKNGDATATKLISTGTEYKFRYVMEYYNYLIGLYSDQSNGSREIRWSNLNDGTEFPSANALFTYGDDIITGCGKMLSGAFIYKTNSIQRIDFYSAINTFEVFGITQSVTGIGCDSHHSIVDISAHVGTPTQLFYSYGNGIAAYHGGNSVTKMSQKVKNTINTISYAYRDMVQGTILPNINEVVWAIPLNGAVTPTHLLRYNYKTDDFELTDHGAFDPYYISGFDFPTGIWSDYTGGSQTWDGLTETGWGQMLSYENALAMGSSDGFIYMERLDEQEGANYTGERYEPVLDFGDPQRNKRLLEIWFFSRELSLPTLHVDVRVGNSPEETASATWKSYTVSLASYPSIVYCNEFGRFIQIKYYTDEKDEAFFLDRIELKYDYEGVR